MAGRNADHMPTAGPSGSPIARLARRLFAGPRGRARRNLSPPSVKRIFFLACAGSLLVSVLVLLNAPMLREWMLAAAPHRPAEAGDTAARSKEIDRLRGRIQNIRKKYDALTPRKPYLVVDTSNNKFRLMEGTKILREGTCSTGSYVLLKAGGDRQWVFKTPRGRFHVQTKKEAPVWYKPDWAFIEEGLPVPPPYSPERYETGVLGDYAMHIGDGYLIHGTLYKRLLGMPVTHGCVRLGDEDLEVVYRNMKVGSPVYIY